MHTVGASLPEDSREAWHRTRPGELCPRESLSIEGTPGHEPSGDASPVCYLEGLQSCFRPHGNQDKFKYMGCAVCVAWVDLAPPQVCTLHTSQSGLLLTSTVPFLGELS